MWLPNVRLKTNDNNLALFWLSAILASMSLCNRHLCLSFTPTHRIRQKISVKFLFSWYGDAMSSVNIEAASF